MEETRDKEPKFRRRAEARPDEVLDAALKLFAAQGFGRTTVEAVARAAGLSKAAVYLYFPSKKALLAGVVRRAVTPVAEMALGQIADYRGDPRPLIAVVMRMLVGRLADPAVFAVPALILREAAVAPEMVQVYREEVLDRVLPAVRGLLAQGVAGGFIRAVDPDLTIRSVMGPVLAHMLMAEVFGIMPEGGLQLDKMIANHLAILFQGLDPEGAK